MFMTPGPTEEHSGSKLSTLAVSPLLIRVFLFLFIIILGWRIFLLDLPVHWDTGVYSVVAHELHQGQRLYTDIFDHKPPGIHITFWLAELVTGYGLQMLLFIGVVFCTITLAGIYSAASSFEEGQHLGLWSAVAWTVVSVDVWTASNQINTEIILNALGIWALAILLRSDERGLTRCGRWTIGVLWAIGSIHKHIMVVPAILLSLVHFLLPPRGISHRAALFDVLIWLFTGIAVWLITAGWFYFDGRFNDFWIAVVTYNSWYSGSMIQNLWGGLLPENWFRENLLGIAPLMVAGLASVFWISWKSLSRKQWLFLAYGVSAWIMLCLPGKFFAHYYQLLVPWLCILFAFVVLQCGRMQKKLPAITGSIIVCVLVGLQLYGVDQFRKRGTLFKEDPYLGEALRLVPWVETLLEEDEKFYVWGGLPELYFMTKRRPVVGMFYMIPGTEDKYRILSLTKFKQDFLRRPPELLIVNILHWGDHEAYRWMVTMYSPLAINTGKQSLHPFKLMALYGGSLEKRIQSASVKSSNTNNRQVP